MSRWDPLLALEFLTVLRLRRYRPAGRDTLARAQAFFPAIGLLLGGLLAVTDLALRPLLPAGPRTAVLIALLAVLSRGLHLDGLADSFDGLFGGTTAQRRLEIMRDPRTGSFGVVAVVLVLLVKWSAAAALIAPWRTAGLLLAPAAGRFGMVVAVASAPYARPDGLGLGFDRAARGKVLLIAAATTAAAAMLLFGPIGGALLLPAIVAGYAVARLATRVLGGATGDIYGAGCELAETLTFLALVVWANRSGPAPWLWQRWG